MRDLFKLLISIVTCETVGLISTPFTLASIPGWYAILNKPFFAPPNWVFGPVWTTLYFLMGVSAFLVWKKGFKNKKIRIALAFFSIQLFLNFIWSIIFFGLHLPLVALIEIIILWIAIFITMIKFKKISKPAFYLLVPYIIWVSIASILNLSIVLLNP